MILPARDAGERDVEGVFAVGVSFLVYIPGFDGDGDGDVVVRSSCVALDDDFETVFDLVELHAAKLNIKVGEKRGDRSEQIFERGTETVLAERGAERVKHVLELALREGIFARDVRLLAPDPLLVCGGAAVFESVILLAQFRRFRDDGFVGGKRGRFARESEFVGDLGHPLLRIVVILKDGERGVDAVDIAVGELTVVVVGAVTVGAVLHLRAEFLAVPHAVGCAEDVIFKDDIVDDELSVAVGGDRRGLIPLRHGGVRLDVSVFERRLCEGRLAGRVIVEFSERDGSVDGVVRRAALGAAVHADVVGLQEALHPGDEVVVVALILAAGRPARAGAGVEVSFLVLIARDRHALGQFRRDAVQLDGDDEVHHDDRGKHDNERHYAYKQSARPSVLDRLGQDDVNDRDQKPYACRDPDAVKRRAVEQHLHACEQLRGGGTVVGEFAHIFRCRGDDDRKREERQTQSIKDHFQRAEKFDLVLAALIHIGSPFFTQRRTRLTPVLPVDTGIAAQCRPSPFRRPALVGAFSPLTPRSRRPGKCPLRRSPPRQRLLSFSCSS